MISTKITANIKEETCFYGEPNMVCYEVTLYEETIISLGTKIIYKSNKTNVVPFLFKSLEVAKDFCEISPKYKLVTLINDDCGTTVHYQTYELSKDHKFLGYIEWGENHTIFNKSREQYGFYPSTKEPLVEKFVKNIRVPDWTRTFGLSDLTFIKPFENVSSLCINENNDSRRVNKQWNFELIEKQYD